MVTFSSCKDTNCTTWYKNLADSLSNGEKMRRNWSILCWSWINRCYSRFFWIKWEFESITVFSILFSGVCFQVIKWFRVMYWSTRCEKNYFFWHFSHIVLSWCNWKDWYSVHTHNINVISSKMITKWVMIRKTHFWLLAEITINDWFSHITRKIESNQL